MSKEDQLSRRFEEIDFSDEPRMSSQPGDDVRRGERLLRRRRAASWTAGVAATAVLATSAAALLPNVLRDDARLQVAGGPDRTPAERVSVRPTPTASPTAVPTPTQESGKANTPALSYPLTRQLLLDTAVEHLDPRRAHLPRESTGFSGGGGVEGITEVGTKLDWTVSGEDGTGMIRVLVTSPGYADKVDYGFETVGGNVGCINMETGKRLCEKQRIPGTSEEVWVAPSQGNLKLGVLYERPDGSYVGIGVSTLFGNNTTIPVSDVDISLEQAMAFVSDPDLKVVPGDDPGDLDDRPGTATESPEK